MEQKEVHKSLEYDKSGLQITREKMDLFNQ